MRKLLITAVLVLSVLVPSVSHAQSIQDRVLGLFRYFQGSGLAAVKKAPTSTTFAPLSGDGIVYSSDALYTWSGTSPETLTITQGTVTFTTNTFSFHPNLIVSVSAGNALFQVPNSLAGLTLNGGSATIATGTNNVLTTKSLSISGSSYLDITNGGVIVDYSGTLANSPIATVKSYLLTGRGCTGICSPAWSGNGIRSSSAATLNALAPEHFGIGYAENSQLPLGSYSASNQFMGQSPDLTSVLIRFTQATDADLDGKTGDNDVTVIGGYYDQDRLARHFYQADFDYNGTVGDNDVTLIGGIYNENLQTTNLVATPSSSSITLNWNKPLYTGSTIILKQIGAGAWFQLTSTQNSTLTDSAVTPGTVYTYQVKGSNGQPSNLVQVKVPAVSQIPAAPSNLVATAVSSTQINLTWSDNSSNETGFVLEKKTGTGSYGTVASPFQNATSYPNTALTPATTYTYRIKATNASGDSIYSNEATATTPANCGTLCVPVLSSKPGAPATIYLDFDGEPAHNFKVNNALVPVPITPAYDRTTPGMAGYDSSSFDATEIAYINEIWKRVAEIYSLFNVNVTTVNPGAPYSDRVSVHVIIGGNGSWAGGYPGTAGFGAFSNPATDNNAYIFSDNTTGYPKPLTTETALRTGSLFSLDTQFAYTPGLTTNPGDDVGHTKAPIMGVGGSFTQRLMWWYGYKSSSGTYQDDIAIISDLPTNSFGYRTDDAGNTQATAVPMSVSGQTRSASGVIEQINDTDYYSFTTAGGSVTINLTGAPVGQMLDPKIVIYNASGQQVAQADTSALTETLTISLPSGTYYAAVSGHGLVTVTGSVAGGDYGKAEDVGSYTVTVTAP
jgi:hypothetical protein